MPRGELVPSSDVEDDQFDYLGEMTDDELRIRLRIRLPTTLEQSIEAAVVEAMPYPVGASAGALVSVVHRREDEIREAGCHECGGPYGPDDAFDLNMATGWSRHSPRCPEIVDATVIDAEP